MTRISSARESSKPLKLSWFTALFLLENLSTAERPLSRPATSSPQFFSTVWMSVCPSVRKGYRPIARRILWSGSIAWANRRADLRVRIALESPLELCAWGDLFIPSSIRARKRFFSCGLKRDSVNSFKSLRRERHSHRSVKLNLSTLSISIL